MTAYEVGRRLLSLQAIDLICWQTKPKVGEVDWRRTSF